MENLKPIIAKNISVLRKEKGMTQSELAQCLNYSDKAVSKWERAESIPDIAVLAQIADLFDVTLDYLIREEHYVSDKQVRQILDENARRNRGAIMGMSILLVWLIALLMYVVIYIVAGFHNPGWLVFVYAVPANMIVWLVLNAVWFNRRWNYFIVSMLMWSVLVTIYLTLMVLGFSSWPMLILGVPGQIIIIMWSRLKFSGRKKKEDENE